MKANEIKNGDDVKKFVKQETIELLKEYEELKIKTLRMYPKAYSELYGALKDKMVFLETAFNTFKKTEYVD